MAGACSRNHYTDTTAKSQNRICIIGQDCGKPDRYLDKIVGIEMYCLNEIWVNDAAQYPARSCRSMTAEPIGIVGCLRLS